MSAGRTGLISPTFGGLLVTITAKCFLFLFCFFLKKDPEENVYLLEMKDCFPLISGCNEGVLISMLPHICVRL